jgi:hypothetical protein
MNERKSDSVLVFLAYNAERQQQQRQPKVKKKEKKIKLIMVELKGTHAKNYGKD